MLICAMDCNPRVQLIDICMPVLEWTAIPESKVRTVSCSSNKMNQPQSPKRKKKPAKKIFFGPTFYTKMGSTKKIANFFAHFACCENPALVFKACTVWSACACAWE